ncbi:MAG: hypothetical protein AAFQ09_11180 [Pseudomonadota bacterium]
MAILAGLVTPISVTSLLETWSVKDQLSEDTTRIQIVAALSLGLINPLILVFTLNAMRKLFAAYKKGEVLTDGSALLIQRIGQGFLALALATFLLRPIQVLLLTITNPPGQRSIAIAVNSEMIFIALSGGLILVIGWAMREASAAAAENRSFV